MKRTSSHIQGHGSGLGDGQTNDLFGTIADGVAEGTAGSLRVGDVLPVERGGGRDASESVSIRWYADLQAAYYKAGLESATAWWKARGVTWP
jgi:hypothetical protein